nr:DUF6122 family protein [Rufibacter sp. LB8]
MVAWLFFRKNWVRVSLILVATYLVDLDHLLATPCMTRIGAVSVSILCILIGPLACMSFIVP